MSFLHKKWPEISGWLITAGLRFAFRLVAWSWEAVDLKISLALDPSRDLTFFYDFLKGRERVRFLKRQHKKVLLA